ncbi:Smr/MutS family protein [Sedimentimonas flavescens]|uniref:Smr/MutS family protein n=1 Tax=Sedimentimonas flavescens TaxID=2851012 RepID=A0ABT2ZYQ8_9RHOB|nr:Smr/MutS family protein [Sedimentimonas flavescens]MBW0158130.1 Smr/MutS family protein [Sedimentimonas flavescens]MCV2878898.1 Smr/MutS family protein [Sedimentimonas flavescens]WBL33239.1 Smr/MutS family protein [Sinirhodobacter sp. HNIBRBA609]
MSRRRKLSPEERELWSRVAATAKAFHPRRPFSAETEPVLDAKPTPPPKKPRPDVKDFRIGQSAPDFAFRHDLAPSISEHLARQPVVMDRKAHRAMTRGKLEPEAKIDLHGMTLAEAHPELIRFVLNAQDRGCRLVLVITGKGKRGLDEGPIPQRQGVLRHQVPQWLRLPPLGAAVMQVSEAHLKHGGSGAYYVYLRRNR